MKSEKPVNLQNVNDCLFVINILLVSKFVPICTKLVLMFWILQFILIHDAETMQDKSYGTVRQILKLIEAY